MSKKRIYLAGGISDKARKNYQKELAEKLESLGYEVYAAARNDSINDKSNNPTPLDIYEADVSKVLSSDIFVMTISGGNEEGTISELGLVSGWNEALSVYESSGTEIEVLAFTTNERIAQPQFYEGIASAGYNHLVLGMIDKWGDFVGNEIDLLDKLEEMKDAK